ncbi:MAG: hypothetical protein NTV81_04335 [Candidatus Komeilibacteria bacterium]|nr:hypothetical protein [Candidatus Komeilibacteria bacterium]
MGIFLPSGKAFAWLGRALSVVVIITATVQLTLLVNRTKDIYGKSRFLSTDKLLITANDIEAVYDDPGNMVDYNLRLIASGLGKVWPGANAQIRFCPRAQAKSEALINWQDQTAAAITFVYDTLSYLGSDASRHLQKKIIGLQFNPSFLEAVRQRGGRQAEAPITVANQLFSQAIQFDGYTNEEDSLRRADQSQGQVAYNKIEMEMLRSFVGIHYLLLGVVLGADSLNHHLDYEERYDLRCQRDGIPGNWMLAYSLYFRDHHRADLQRKNTWYKIDFLIFTLLLGLFIFRFFRPGLYEIISAEFKVAGVGLSWPILGWLMLANLSFVVLPLKAKSTRQKIQAACQKIRDIQWSQVLTQQADKLWEQLRPHVVGEELQRLKANHRIASGQTNSLVPLPTRQQHLFALLDAWQRIREGLAKEAATIGQPVKLVEPLIAGKPTVQVPSLRKAAEARILSLLPLGARLNLAELPSPCLERLTLALLVLPQLHSQAIEYLLRQNDLRGLLSPGSRFTKAVLTGDVLTIESILKLPVPKLSSQSVSAKNFPHLLQGCKIVVIGGGLMAKENQLRSALAELDALEVKFVNPFESLGKALDSSSDAGPNTLFLHFVAQTNHKVTFSLQSHSRRVIHFSYTSPHRFQAEIIVGRLRLG